MLQTTARTRTSKDNRDIVRLGGTNRMIKNYVGIVIDNIEEQENGRKHYPKDIYHRRIDVEIESNEHKYRINNIIKYDVETDTYTCISNVVRLSTVLYELEASTKQNYIKTRLESYTEKCFEKIQKFEEKQDIIPDIEIPKRGLTQIYTGTDTDDLDDVYAEEILGDIDSDDIKNTIPAQDGVDEGTVIEHGHKPDYQEKDDIDVEEAREEITKDEPQESIRPDRQETQSMRHEDRPQQNTAAEQLTQSMLNNIEHIKTDDDISVDGVKDIIRQTFRSELGYDLDH
ncbi:MAG: hypothetical protein J07AB43_00180 [Candidatus Nanosalina sp. J07AB43]|nr:MAG: hypothetical protein J07AB43_00180 [Candidatus Nanosalina sp. J07AB43]